ncbi:MAG: hypothetical protein R2801_08295 [Chitinophagales bacterium]
MKKIIFISTAIITLIFTSCGVDKTTYNDKIVTAHTALLEINQNVANNFENYLGKLEQKDAFVKFIDESLAKMQESKKTIEDLKPIEDEGMRDKLLEMYDTYTKTLELYKSKADIITNDANYDNVVELYNDELEKIQKLDTEIKIMQEQFASKNNIQLK